MKTLLLFLFRKGSHPSVVIKVTADKMIFKFSIKGLGF